MRHKKIAVIVFLIFIVGCSNTGVLEYKDIKLQWLGQSSFKIVSNKKIIYIDPFQVKENQNDADLIFITHEHYDHCSKEDIAKISKKETKIIASEKCAEKLSGNIKSAKPGEKFIVEGIYIETIPSYGVEQSNHKKSNENIGFIINLKNVMIYHAGDSSRIPEMKKINVDIAMLPIDKENVISVEEAAQASSEINAAVFVPMHYKDKSDAEQFKILAKKYGKSVNILEQPAIALYMKK